jgi:hypothetical protein
MIPFADDVEKFQRIQSVYAFDILTFGMTRWDALAKEFYPGAPTKYMNRLRKLSVFDAKGAATIYLDIDTVVLKDLSFLAEPLASGKADLICTATANDPWVYNQTYKDHPKLRLSRRFSDGFFAFNPRKVDADLAYNTIVANKDLFLSVRAEVYSQPATNFVADMNSLQIGEVFRLFPNISPQAWYNSPKLNWIDNQVVSDDGREVLFVHWAGPVEMSEKVRFRELFDTYCNRGRSRAVGHIWDDATESGDRSTGLSEDAV